MKPRKKRVDPFVWAALLLGAFVLLGWWLGRADQAEDDQQYCRQVTNGAWPDYRMIYEDVCRPVKTPARTR